MEIAGRRGFRLAAEKTDFGRLGGEICITGVRITDDHINPSAKFMTELDRLITDHASLAAGGPFDGPLLVESELFGKARYACYLNPGRKRSILAKLKEIKWDAVMNNALDQGLCRYRERITERGQPRPSCEEPLALAAGRKYCREHWEKKTVDPDMAPWE